MAKKVEFKPIKTSPPIDPHKSAIHSMTFNQPCFKVGLDASLRKGDKWAKRIKLNDTLKFVTPKGVYLGSALVCGFVTCKLSAIPEKLLRMSGYRDSKNALLDMQNYYSEVLTDDEIYTVVLFEIEEGLQTEERSY